MSFFDKLKKGAQEMADKSEELMGTAKIKLQITKVESDIGKKKSELGAAAYKLYKEGKISDPDLVGVCQAIDNLYQEIDKLNAQLKE